MTGDTVSDAADFIDATLQNEASWERADALADRLGDTVRVYGASVGAVRGTVRDAARRYPGMTHDTVTALSSALWRVPVFERRLAAVVLLQSHVRLLTEWDLTRLEGFVRGAELTELIDPLATDVIAPLVAQLDSEARARAQTALQRWALSDDANLRRAARLGRPHTD